MAKPTPAAVEKDIEALQADYEAWLADEEEERELAGLKPLLTRAKRLIRRSRTLKKNRGREVAAQIQALVSDMKLSHDALSDELDDDGFGDKAFDELADRIFEGEEIDDDALIASLGGLDEGLDEALAAALGRRAGFLLARYNRHFGGRDRTTRDLALLEDLHQQLTMIMSQLSDMMVESMNEDLMDRLEMLAEQAELWANEAEAIDKARGDLRGRPWAEALGALARELVAQWEIEVAGHPPLTVRPKLAARFVGTLEYVRRGLATLADHALSEDPDLPGEISQLDALLASWRDARQAMKDARKASTRDDRQKALEVAAGELTMRWASQVQALPSAEREAAVVGGLCDRMYELERQLSRLDDGDEAHARFLGFVRDQLHQWELTYEKLAG